MVCLTRKKNDTKAITEALKILGKENTSGYWRNPIGYIMLVIVTPRFVFKNETNGW